MSIGAVGSQVFRSSNFIGQLAGAGGRQKGPPDIQNGFDPSQIASKVASSFISKQDANGDGVLSVDEVGQSEKVFDQLDTSGDGVVDSDELSSAILQDIEAHRSSASAGPPRGGDPTAFVSDAVSRLLSERDGDGDGALTVDELGLSEDLFNGIDTNQDGVVDSGELSSAILQDIEAHNPGASAGPPDPTTFVSDIVNTIFSEEDGDGDGVLTIEELGLSQELPEGIDTNGDGVIDSEELSSAILEDIEAHQSAGAGRPLGPSTGSPPPPRGNGSSDSGSFQARLLDQLFANLALYAGSEVPRGIDLTV